MRSFSHMGNLYKNDARSHRSRRRSGAPSAPLSVPKPSNPRTPVSAVSLKSTPPLSNSQTAPAPFQLSSVFSCVAEDGGLFSCAGGQQKDLKSEGTGDINILDLISTPTKD